MPVVDFIPVKTRTVPAASRDAGENTGFFDFGDDAFGRLEFVCRADAETEIECAIGEVLTPDGRLDRNPGGSRVIVISRIRVRPGTANYRLELPRHPDVQPGSVSLDEEVVPFRYAEFSGNFLSVEPVRITMHAPFNPDAAEFHSSSDTLNRVWELCRHTIKATTVFGVYIDGNRERLPYEGDAYINQLGHFALDTEYSIAQRTIDHLFKFPTWPTEWLLAMPFIVRDYYLHSADRDSLRRWYSGLTSKLLLNFSRADGLLSTEGNRNPHDIVDWPAAERDGYEFGAVNLVPNCYLHQALRDMAFFAGELELPEDAGYYRKRAALVKSSIRRTMWKNGRFTDHPGSDHMSLHSAVFAVLFDIAEPGELPELASFIRSRGMACSVFAAQFLLEACYKCGLAGHALELMTADTLRSWMNMIRKGATITMEAWDDSIKPNQDWNHAWGAAPANIIPRGIFGIRPLKPGFAEFAVNPQPDGLETAFCRYPTIHGPVTVEILPDRINLTVPAGTLCRYRETILEPGRHSVARP